MNRKYFHKKKGIAALPVMMILGGLALTIAIGITSVAFSDLIISQGSTNSTKALVYAETGARDALWKISHNKNYSCVADDCYSINFTTNGCSENIACSKVYVSSATGDIANPKVITSKGISGSSIRTLSVSVVLDSGTNDTALQYGKITSTTWNEITE